MAGIAVAGCFGLFGGSPKAVWMPCNLPQQDHVKNSLEDSGAVSGGGENSTEGRKKFERRKAKYAAKYDLHHTWERNVQRYYNSDKQTDTSKQRAWISFS